jgi:hypothetical protein
MRVGLNRIAIAICAVAVAAMLPLHAARADDLNASAAQMSEQSFALLNSLNAQSSGGSANPLLGPIASFASDTETLSDALAKNDLASAASAASTLQSDRATVDTSLALHPGTLKAGDWNAIKQRLDMIVKQIAAAGGKAVVSGAAGSSAPAVAAATAAAPAPTAGSVAHSDTVAVTPPPAATPPTDTSAAPRLVINSRQTNGDVIRIKGYMEGRALKSAGIYENGRQLQAFKVNNIPGEQKVDFDIGLGNPSSDTTMRVTDAEGRFAEAPVINTTLAAGELPSLAPATPPNEAGVEVDRGSRSAAGAGGANTAEIPSHGPIERSPSKRHSLSGQLGNVQINILGVTQSETSPPTYDVVGQIAGRGITRAGIYVNGRLVKEISIDDDANFTSFDQRFVMMNGGDATIRAYGAGDQFVENSIDLSNGMTAFAPMPMAPMVPMAPQGLAVQITAVRPVTSNLYVVAGTISGKNLASAGLYQNGMLVENLNVGGGIGGMLGAIIPGNYRSVNFSARFNPAAGQTSVRAFDSSGAYTEQPVMAGGVNPYATNPYAGGVNPYAGGVNPFGSPVNPYYGTPPVNPYMTPYNNPYNRPTTPARPLW